MGKMGNGPDWLNPTQLHSISLADKRSVNPLTSGAYSTNVPYGCHDILHYYLTRHGVCSYWGQIEAGNCPDHPSFQQVIHM
jgi:hypothetical protein